MATLKKGGALLTSQDKADFRAGIGLDIATSGLVATVPSFQVGDFAFGGGQIALLPNGTWYIGVEISSGQLRTLPRLGHRGWIPVGRAVTGASAVISLERIEPVVPSCRIPRTTAKILTNKPINVVVMGSSLTASGGAGTDWPGMVFGGGATDKYRLPTTVSCQYTGVGGSPNQYQLAQLGYASTHSSYGFNDSGASGGITASGVPNGRSNLFSGVDLVVIGCLANGGDYRLETIEPLVRKLRQTGVEVIMVTDNPQNPSTIYSSMASAGLYVDGPEVLRVAELYGVEVADTAAYVFDAHLRAGGVGIYGDTIHMASGIPSDPSALIPANGHESWARAVRSIFGVGIVESETTVINYSYDFASSTQGWVAYSSANVSNSGGVLQVIKNTSSSAQWGTIITLPVTLQAGDTVDLTATATHSGFEPAFGMQGGGWASNIIGSAGSGVVTTGRLTCTKETNQLLMFGNFDAAPLNTTMTLDNVALIVTAAGVATLYDVAPTRPAESRSIPNIRVVTDMKTPADAFVILPKDEFYLRTSNTNRGALSAHPWGANSFARRWSSSVGATQDLLVLGVGKKAIMGADAAVALSLIHYREVADGACTFDVNINGVLSKTVSITAVPFGNEWFLPIYTPTQFNAAGPCEQGTIEIVVTSGTLKIAAFAALTADVDYLIPEQISFVGAGWLPKEESRSGLPGRPTDTAGDFAVARCTGRRIAWVISGNPGSKQVQTWSDRNISAAINYGGNYHIYTVGEHVGPGANHVIKCVEANASGSQANGRALHVGGAVIINDR